MTPEEIKAALAIETDPVKIAQLSAQLDGAPPPAPAASVTPPGAGAQVPNLDIGGGVPQSMRDPNGAATLPAPTELKQGVAPESTIGRVKPPPAPAIPAPGEEPALGDGAAPSGADLASQAVNFVDTAGGSGGPVTTKTTEQTTKIPTANTAAIQGEVDSAHGAQAQAELDRGQAALNQGIDQAGIALGGAKAVSDAADKAAAEAKDTADQVIAAVEGGKKARDDYAKETRDQSLEIAAGKSLGRKLAGAIAVALGGFGASLGHHENEALKIIQMNAAEDFNARKARLEGKKGAIDAADNLLEKLHQHYGDWKAVGAAYQAAIKERTALQLDARAKLGVGEEAKAKGDRAAADIRASAAEDLKKADAMAQASVTTKQKQVSGGNGAAAKLKLYGLALDNAIKVQKLTGANGEGMKAEEYEKTKALYTTHAALDQAEAAIKKNGVPVAGLRALSRMGNKITDIPTALAALVSNNTISSEEANTIGATMGALNAAIYEATGKAMNVEEGVRKMQEFGMGENATAASTLDGMRRMRDTNEKKKNLLFSAFGSSAAMAWKRADDTVTKGGFEPPTTYGAQRGK